MDKKDNNFKKLLCYNIVNNLKCLYKTKCMFAHTLDEQNKDSYRGFINDMIYEYNDLSNININDNKELYEELLIYTKECKNCINKKCPGGYNCKFGVCMKELKVCYNDLLYGKCTNQLTKEIINNEKQVIIHRCINGIHLSEKNLIPYYQRLSNEINILDNGSYLCDNINYFSKINTISLILNEKTIKIAKYILSKKNNKYEGNIINEYNEYIKKTNTTTDDILELEDCKSEKNDNDDINNILQEYEKINNKMEDTYKKIEIEEESINIKGNIIIE
jgi:hypothetical protein